MKELIRPVKGTRDFYPVEMAERSWMIEAMRTISNRFGYQEYDGPCLETLDLYAAKSGEELVKEQSFVFPDRGGDQIALRPELTPTLARMIAAKQNELVFPLRWWAFGPFWRYERPQKGRSREFFQWNIDLLGVDKVEADAEIVAVAARFLEFVGLGPDKVKIFVNDRRLMDACLEQLGLTKDKRMSAFRLIDKLDKLSPLSWEKYALEQGLSQEQIAGLKTILDDKLLWKKSEDLSSFFRIVDWLGIKDYVEFDPQIIRGLDYYTGIVFEGKDVEGKFRAIFGGGHYDNLVADVGGNSIPGVGFAMGDVVIQLVLKAFNCIPSKINTSSKVMVTVFDEQSLEDTYRISTKLRNAGINVLTYPEADKLSKQIKFADRMGIQLAIIVGPDERLNGSVAIKNLLTREQVVVKFDQVTEQIREFLD
ncbi:MAG: histidine--tRNA ligase [Anaerolineaceae bacterium]|nr:histidine--tRNA ligase [Anaerolineaceae bacterium]